MGCEDASEKEIIDSRRDKDVTADEEARKKGKVGPLLSIIYTHYFKDI